MSNRNKFPDEVVNDKKLIRKIIVAVAECAASTMDESDWKKFAILYDLAALTTERHRFLRSLSWNDPDHEGMVVELVDHVFINDPDAFFHIFNNERLQLRFTEKHPELSIYFKSNDSLVDAISHSVSELIAVRNIVDLSQYLNRIQSALPNDPSQAIGATKDMLEATMRTIMDGRGKPTAKDIDFPTLATRCMTELGLTPNSPPTSDSERYVRKIASAAKGMIETANELRNVAGTGHGRVVGRDPLINAADASLVASSGMILAAWLLRRQTEF